MHGRVGWPIYRGWQEQIQCLSRLPILLLSSLEVYVSVGRFNEAGEKRTV